MTHGADTTTIPKHQRRTATCTHRPGRSRSRPRCGPARYRSDPTTDRLDRLRRLRALARQAVEVPAAAWTERIVTDAEGGRAVVSVDPDGRAAVVFTSTTNPGVVAALAEQHPSATVVHLPGVDLDALR